MAWTIHIRRCFVLGIAPLKELNNIFGEFEGIECIENHRLFFINCEFESKLEDLERVLYRYFYYIRLLENRLAELAPGDPLINDPFEIVKAITEKAEEHLEKLKKQRDEKMEAANG